MKKFLLLFALISLDSSAQSLCDRINKGVVSYLNSSESRISFKNSGGLFNGGVCWWHARLQRSSAYLAEFKPAAPSPTAAELKLILRQLKQMNKVVTISGFNNFSEFTATYQKEIQSVLEAWQREDGFFNHQWIRGISGNYELPAEKMKERMNILYDQFLKSPQPIWIMAQIKGVESHAFLVLDMLPTNTGFDLKVIDSNAPTRTKKFEYLDGHTFLQHPQDNYSFVPYLGFQNDFELIKTSANKYCGGIFSLSKDMPVGEVEVGQ